MYFDCIDADGAIEAGQCDGADILVVDPPRKGLSEGVLNFLTGKHEQKSLAGKKGTLISRQKCTLTTPSSPPTHNHPVFRPEKSDLCWMWIRGSSKRLKVNPSSINSSDYIRLMYLN